MKTGNLDKAGFELAHLALVLYKERFYRRDQSALADNLVNSAIDAGRSVAEVQITPAANRGAAARDALDKVNRLVFVVYLLKDEGLYTDHRIAPIIDYAQKIRGELQEYITVDSKRTRPAPFRYATPAGRDSDELDEN